MKDQPVKALKSFYSVNNSLLKHAVKDRHYLILFLPCFIYLVIFKYIPIAGIVVSFQNFRVSKGLFGSKWIGFDHFITFFNSPDFFIILKNTVLLGLYSLIAFPVPIIFALLLNEIANDGFKRTVQTISYLPFFLSTVVVCSIIWNFLSPDGGLVNRIISIFGFEPIYFMAKTEWFRTIYVSSGIWQNTGYNSIIFFAAITGVSQELYNAAEIDGCNRLGKVLHVTIPGISLTIAVMFILSVGGIISIGFEKALLLQTPATYEVSDVIGTYVYRVGIQKINYGFASAVGLFESVVSLILIVTANHISKKVSDTAIW